MNYYLVAILLLGFFYILAPFFHKTSNVKSTKKGFGNGHAISHRNPAT